MGNKLTERNDRLRKQRTKWRRHVETVEGYWKDCSEDDREQMRSELRQQISALDADLESSNVDDFTRLELRGRLDSLMRNVA
jgi:hypothetical protein